MRCNYYSSRPAPLLLVAGFAAILSASAAADFSFEEDKTHLTLYEDGRPVFVYNFGVVQPSTGIDRAPSPHSAYLHPVYGVRGDVLTGDFPSDHYHQRGIFWGWPEGLIGDRRVDTWSLLGVRQQFEKWLARETTAGKAILGIQNGWILDGDTFPIVREYIQVVTHASESTYRIMDFRLRIENISKESIRFLGAKGKGYGGFNIRLDAEHKPFTFYTDRGEEREDMLRAKTPWAGVTWTNSVTGRDSGTAVFQHRHNPGYPHDGWILRHYGLLGAAWPHKTPFELKSSASFELQYRVVLYGAEVGFAELESLFRDYESEAGNSLGDPNK